VIGIIALLISILLPSLNRAREQANRVKCASNLRQIGQGIQMYANENKGNFPRTQFQVGGGLITTNQGAQNQNSFPTPPATTGPVGVNNVCASFFLLLKTQDLTGEVFICPSSQGERGFAGGQNLQDFSNFEKIPGNLSYSYQVAFPTQNARNAGFKFNNTLSSDFAMAADMNPGTTGVTGNPDNVRRSYNSSRRDMQEANSNNHNGEGQEVLYADGHVDWSSTPYCGSPRPGPGGFTAARDNIFTAGNADGPQSQTGATCGPKDQFDSVIIPSDDEGAGNRP